MCPVKKTMCGLVDLIGKSATAAYTQLNEYSQGTLGKHWTVMNASASQYADSLHKALVPHQELIAAAATMVAGLSFVKAAFVGGKRDSSTLKAAPIKKEGATEGSQGAEAAVSVQKHRSVVSTLGSVAGRVTNFAIGAILVTKAGIDLHQQYVKSCTLAQEKV